MPSQCQDFLIKVCQVVWIINSIFAFVYWHLTWSLFAHAKNGGNYNQQAVQRYLSMKLLQLFRIKRGNVLEFHQYNKNWKLITFPKAKSVHIKQLHHIADGMDAFMLFKRTTYSPPLKKQARETVLCVTDCILLIILAPDGNTLSAETCEFNRRAQSCRPQLRSNQLW